MIKYIDLFAGMGGIRIGFEQACKEKGLSSKCVFTSEIKKYAVDIYKHNFSNEVVYGDITKINEKDIPDFDFLLGGFPCQSFSFAGKRQGFNDTRGTLFFDILRIIKHKKPKGFLLENVEGLVTHDRKNKNDKIGNTLNVIIKSLEDIGYKVSWSVLNASDFGIPQKRKRVYIAGTLNSKPNLNNFPIIKTTLSTILEKGVNCEKTIFRERLLSLYKPEYLMGKSIKDKRGGSNNIHSWDLELKGFLSENQKELMSKLLKERRKKIWAKKIGIDWMDGMPLTTKQIFTFFNKVKENELQEMLNDLTKKKYIKIEYPKKLIRNEDGTTSRVPDLSKEEGYNIVTGKLSFELNKILDPNEEVNTIVATEVSKLGVLDKGGIRTLTNRECLRLFGFPDWYSVNIEQKKLYDLIGNTVVVPVIRLVSLRILDEIKTF